MSTEAQYPTGTVTGVDAEGNPTHSEFVLDPETGQSVHVGDELSANAQQFMDMLGMVGEMVADDSDLEGS
jgi:hypothetical protein